MDGDVLMWIIGIFIVAMGGLAKLAYSDPTFYLETIDGYIDKAICVTFFFAIGFGGALYIFNEYVLHNLDLSDKQSDKLAKAFAVISEQTGLAIILIVVTFFWTFLLINIANRKKAHLKNS